MRNAEFVHIFFTVYFFQTVAFRCFKLFKVTDAYYE